MIETKNLKNLLQDTKQIFEHQQELERLKGESFNVFSILKMETKENETHSAFLTELLSPDGSHLKGRLFLKLFLETIKPDLNEIIDIESAVVKPEYVIGKVDLAKEEGGRIDIFIWDKNGNSISVENKINAGDQEVQIKRYCNYSLGGKNIVFYLTENGKKASEKSKGKLKEGKDYYPISYKEHIQLWLQQCLKEAAEEPILRESIKQYLILIKKLTKSMDRKTEKELADLMFKNFEESEYVFSNFQNAKHSVQDELRKAVFNKLNDTIKDKCFIKMGNVLTRTHAQIWIRSNEKPEAKLLFGVESFNGRGQFNGLLFVGILNQGGKPNEFTKANKTSVGNHWVNVQYIRDSYGSEICLADSKILKKLYFDEKYLAELSTQIVLQVKSYIEEHYDSIITYLNDKNK